MRENSGSELVETGHSFVVSLVSTGSGGRREGLQVSVQSQV